jgi:hypothetical protein
MIPLEVNYWVNTVTHLAGRAQQFRFRRPYPDYFGGVCVFPRKDFEKINGFNNDYWGWGAEDDDLRDRCNLHNIPITWGDGKFRSLSHRHALSSPSSKNLYKANSEKLAAKADYNNGLSNCGYKMNQVTATNDLRVIKVSI